MKEYWQTLAVSKGWLVVQGPKADKKLADRFEIWKSGAITLFVVTFLICLRGAWRRLWLFMTVLLPDQTMSDSLNLPLRGR